MRSLILACTIICCIGAASAQTASWPDRTAGDVEAAYRLIYENHPGVLPELGDVDFQKRLAAAREKGMRLAASAVDYMGYVRSIRAFAATFDDDNMKWTPSREMDRFTLPPVVPRIGTAGFSYEENGGAYWVGIESFFRTPLVDPELFLNDLRAKAPALRAAKRVVIDLRGNSGPARPDEGDGVLLAIYSPEEVARTTKWRRSAECTATRAKRASPANYKAQLEMLPSEFPESLRAEMEKIGEAIAGGKHFSVPFERACVQPSGATQAKPAERGRVIVVTDFGCRDGCLKFLERARALGAVHVGQKTRSENWYDTYCSENLPSGLGAFQMEHAVNFGRRRLLGPFEPTYLFDGDIADTAAVKTWIAGLKI